MKIVARSNKNLIWWILGGLLVMGLAVLNWKKILSGFLQQWEGFSAVPYWDVSRWSWGYGTRVPGSVNDRSVRPGGTITRSQAMSELLNFSQSDYKYLAPRVSAPLNSKQWAAFLSFSYNLGTDDAIKLLPNLNAKNYPALGVQWNKYIYSGGVINPDLVDRRAAEWELFNS